MKRKRSELIIEACNSNYHDINDYILHYMIEHPDCEIINDLKNGETNI